MLSNHFNVVPLIKDGKIIQLSINNGTIFITIRDSYLILPSSLRKLAISFNVSNKTYFPYDFVNNISISLNYFGPIPEFKYWSNISLSDFEKIRTNNWSLRSESIKYCEQDCISWNIS